jgi:predicted metalloprotease
VVPESFTHGTSAQRSRWFTTGWKNGTIAACDTSNAPSL